MHGFIVPDSRKNGRIQTSLRSPPYVLNGTWKRSGGKMPQAGKGYAAFAFGFTAQRALISADYLFLAAARSSPFAAPIPRPSRLHSLSAEPSSNQR